MNTKIAPGDLTQHPPRSFQVRLGGSVFLPRMFDKGRANLAKSNGEYKYNSVTDQHLVKFLGFDPEAILKEVVAGKGDREILGWVQSNSKIPRAPWEVEAWSAYMEKRGPDSDGETLTGFTDYSGNSARLAKTSRRGSTPLSLTPGQRQFSANSP
jgi:hypothetical protein